jgi:uncharacterized protein
MALRKLAPPALIPLVALAIVLTAFAQTDGPDTRVPSEKELESEIRQAVFSDNLAKVKTMLKSDPGLLLVKDEDGQTLLHYAAECGDVRLVEHRDPATLDVLYYSVVTESAGVLEFLLTNKPDVNVRDKDGRTPLHLAVNRKRAELLLAHGANVNARDKDGRTPLHDAALTGYKDVVAVLLAAKADVNAADEGGATPLLLVDRTLDVARLLLAAKANVNVKDAGGDTPLRRAASIGDTNMVELLRQHGARE